MTKIKKSATDPHPAGQAPEDLEIDLGAAMPARAPKPKRGRPRSAAPKVRNPNRKIRKDKGIKKTKKIETHYINNNILMDNKIMRGNDIDYSDNEETKLKDKMTEKELKFIGLFLKGEYSKIKAMILAGYEGYSESALYAIASKIVEKYESQAGDHRIIARAMGAGEVLVFKTLLELMGSKNERIKLDATVNLAKILGCTKEQLEGAGGLTIIFEGPDHRQVHVTGPGAPPLPGSPAPEQSGSPAPTYTRPLQITR
jgi:hypothetical protein